MKKRLASFNWKLALLLVIFVPLCVWLGFWQVSRAEEKRQLQASYERRMAAPAQVLAALDSDSADLAFVVVKLTGQFDNAHSFLLDNRIYQGKPGFEVITPFKTHEGLWVLINRGWVAGKALHSQLPSIPVIEGTLALEGYIYVPHKPAVMGDAQEVSRWPQVIEAADMAFIGKRLHQKIFPYTIRVLKGGADTLVREWVVANMPATKHVAYAAQWFLLAVVLVGFFVYSAWPRKGESVDE